MLPIPPTPRYPGLQDIGDWNEVFGVPNTESASPNAKNWHALLRLFTWMVVRQTELEERIAKLEAAAVPVPVVILDASEPLAQAIPEVIDAIRAAES